MVVSPVRNEDEAVGAPSMREMIQRIDNDRDFETYVRGHTSSLPPRPAEIRYEKHPVRWLLALDLTTVLKLTPAAGYGRILSSATTATTTTLSSDPIITTSLPAQSLPTATAASPVV